MVRLVTDDVERRWRVTQLTDAGERRIEAARISAAVYEAPVGEAAAPVAASAPQFAPPALALLDLPLIDGAPAGAALLAAYADPWPGAIALYRETAGEPLLAGLAPAPATMGRMQQNLWPSASSRIQRWSLRVTLSSGAFESVSEAAMLDGANMLAVETSVGWEVLQFQNAELGGDGVWTISNLIRGRFGTERAAMTGAEAGARAVLLTSALGEVALPLALRGEALSFRGGPERDHPLEATYAELQAIWRARSLVPLSPVFLKATPAAGGVRLAWIRRTRLADDFEGEVPLGEAYERYRLYIYDGETVLRTVEVSGPFADGAPEWLYDAATIAADFPEGFTGGAAFDVAQLSDLVGEGERGRGMLG